MSKPESFIVVFNRTQSQTFDNAVDAQLFANSYDDAKIYWIRHNPHPRNPDNDQETTSTEVTELLWRLVYKEGARS